MFWTHETAFESGEILLPGKKKQGPMEEMGPCHYKGDHLRIIAKSQWYAGIIAHTAWFFKEMSRGAAAREFT